ncbi:MAG TPA: PQQ-dependent sugar dehydrogenase, partial [Gemmatimonadales bacterium]|nr:PQQ-dependent sugar dehydrogenase [Gemmatimonadales bacterium]
MLAGCMLLIMLSRRIGIVLALVFAPACSDIAGTPGDLGLTLELVTDQLQFPVDLTTPTGDPRLFVVERAGRIRVIRDGALLPTPFLDISDRVTTAGSEQGLLGLAFDPEYATNGRLVVNYTNLNGDTRISAFRVTADPDIADPNSEELILGVPQPFANHNGGQLAFGPTGHLYIALGDGGGGGDPDDNAQNLATLLGKLLRINLHGETPYAIPPDNPFAFTAERRGEVWSYGLRNPWRFSFDRVTGDLYIADVGEGRLEEVNVSVTSAAGAGRGVNYGWDRMEGRECFEPASGCDETDLELPVLQYDHSEGCAVT